MVAVNLGNNCFYSQVLVRLKKALLSYRKPSLLSWTVRRLLDSRTSPCSDVSVTVQGDGRDIERPKKFQSRLWGESDRDVGIILSWLKSLRRQWKNFEQLSRGQLSLHSPERAQG